MVTLEDENRALREEIAELKKALLSLATRLASKETTVDDYIRTIMFEKRFKDLKPVVKASGISGDRMLSIEDIQLLIDTIDKWDYTNTTKNQRLVVLRSSIGRYSDLVSYFDDNAPSYRGIKSDKIALTLDEMKRLSEVEPITPLEEVCKTLFFIMARTGARISDALTLSMYNVNNGILKYHAKKTCQPCMVRVSNDTVELLKLKTALKEDALITWGDESYFTHFIKEKMTEMAERAGINALQTVVKKGKTITTERYNLISSHVARTTFATLAYTEYRWDVATIQKALGHTSPAMTMKYIKSVMVQGEEILVDKF